MHKMLVVDDEYMILEGMKYLLPYADYQVEIVHTAENAEDALAYFLSHPVDIVLTDVSMPDMTGLEMIQKMKEVAPATHFIIMSGFQEFEYAKKALVLGAMDYLVKPINKQDLARLLQALPVKETASVLVQEFLFGRVSAQQLLAETRLAWFVVLRDRPPISAYREKQLSHQTVYLQLQPDSPQDCLYREKLGVDTTLSLLLDKAERHLFYGRVAEDLQSTTGGLYQELLPLLHAGQLPALLEQLPHIKERLLASTPAPYLTKQFFNQLMTDIYHYFNQWEQDQLESFFVASEAASCLVDLVALFHHHLLSLSVRTSYSPHVQEILQLIQRDYAKELSLKEISASLYLNTVYLGQLIKKETGHTFAELLNNQRMKVAQGLLVTSSLGIEEICFQVGYTNVGYFYKIFKRFCGESPKTYRQKMGSL